MTAPPEVGLNAAAEAPMTAAEVAAFSQPGGPGGPGAQGGPGSPGPLTDTLVQGIRRAAANAPRSGQTAIGPSEVGQPCVRRLAYRCLDWPKTNTTGDPWAAVVGTAVHAWLAAAFAAPEEGGRWLVERRVEVAPGLSGSCDLYDTETDTVIDWKVVGATTMRTYRSQGPRRQYVDQAQLYGRGFERAGFSPKTVALAFLPRAGNLGGLWVWSAPYDPERAKAAVGRLDVVRDLVARVDPERHPRNWSIIPASRGHECTYCPWFSPGSTDLSRGCPGHLD
ncbi:hypothetical protein ACGFNU_01955 [Spirillospora sp. NPDC048911]|uniref:hypothetical protein n=1 Tax=Spirillospora sp. NPDC048911 TaxID=3364527 RepID=UPI0037247BC4